MGTRYPPEPVPMAISAAVRASITRLGGRVAELRKALSIAQVQMAEALNVSQQTIDSCEVGRPRIRVSTLPSWPEARLLGVTVEGLLVDEATGARKRDSAPKLQRQIERIRQLPRTQQKFVMQMPDTPWPGPAAEGAHP